jgi:hypothetical protein
MEKMDMWRWSGNRKSEEESGGRVGEEDVCSVLSVGSRSLCTITNNNKLEIGGDRGPRAQAERVWRSHFVSD